MHILLLLNFALVLLFGVFLALAFVGLGFKKHCCAYFLIYLLFGLIQLAAFLLFGDVFLFKTYPLLIHLPLVLLIMLYYKKGLYFSLIAVLSAYLFCTPRKWAGTFVSSFWDYSPEVSFIAQIAVTIPLLLIIIRYIAPYVARLEHEDNEILRLFIAVPLLYYFIEYGITVYTDLLYTGGAVVVEFMDAVIVAVYFIFSVIYLKTLYEKKEIAVEQAVLKLMADQSLAEMRALRLAQEKDGIYRHDLRHHLNYLHGCIGEGRLQEAQDYIASIGRQIEASLVRQYTENETINLILSSYADQAEADKVSFDVQVTTPDFSRISPHDLCSLLANGLENAINACRQIPSAQDRLIRLRIFQKNGKLCLDLRNSYYKMPKFCDGVPVSREEGHGFGTKSMVSVVEKHHGLWQFAIQEGQFVFQAAL